MNFNLIINSFFNNILIIDFLANMSAEEPKIEAASTQEILTNELVGTLIKIGFYKAELDPKGSKAYDVIQKVFKRVENVNGKMFWSLLPGWFRCSRCSLRELL